MYTSTAAYTKFPPFLGTPRSYQTIRVSSVNMVTYKFKTHIKQCMGRRMVFIKRVHFFYGKKNLYCYAVAFVYNIIGVHC